VVILTKHGKAVGSIRGVAAEKVDVNPGRNGGTDNGKGKGLYKRGNTWWLRYAGPDGRIRFESSRSSSFKIAEALLIQRKKEVLEGKDPLPVKGIATTSFQELAEYYLS